MKKQICLIGLIGLIWFCPKTALAAEASPSARAQEILLQVTDKVTQITNTLRRTYGGKIKSVGTASVVITTNEGDKTVVTNDATSFYKIRAGNRGEIGFNNLKAADDLVAIGTIDPANFEMTAKQIIVKVRRYNLVGTITAVSKNIATVKEFAGPESQVDLADAVALKKISGGKIVPAKVADFVANSTIFAIAYLPDPTSGTLSALKALLY
jgi:hypothetical protein